MATVKAKTPIKITTPFDAGGGTTVAKPVAAKPATHVISTPNNTDFGLGKGQTSTTTVAKPKVVTPTTGGTVGGNTGTAGGGTTGGTTGGNTGGGNTGGGNTGGSNVDPTIVKPTATGQTWTDPITGDQYSLMSDNSKVLLASDTYGIQRKSAFDLLQQQFQTYGLIKPGETTGTDLLATLKSLIYSGAGNDTVSLALQQSDAYKARFSGNTARVAAGLSVLSPAEYLATESSYDQVLKAAGFPAGYNTQAKFAQFIGNDMSPTELTDRVNIAAKSIANKDPFYTQSLQNYYGLSAGDMIAHAVDPQATLPLLQRQQGSAEFGAAAARQGLGVTSSTAQQYQALGVTQAQAEQGFQNIGTQLPNDEKLAQIYGGQFGTPNDQQSLLQAATFGGPNAAQAQLQLKKLQQQETNAFSGSAGVAKGSLQGDQGGTF